ncbi:MAG: rRNA maturation RNase YbeY [Rickettsiales bacterium]|nr:rRNA maturation RNase YbeY [Rickettsiales bacterium]
MTSELTIHLQDKRWKSRLSPYCKYVTEICNTVLRERRVSGPVALSIILTDDKSMAELNHSYRGKNRPTNVLSFPGDGEHLGDIFLAYETIGAEAKAQKKLVADHTTHLLVHGILHLLGFDHERDDEADKMEAEEIKILKKLCINNPYL